MVIRGRSFGRHTRTLSPPGATNGESAAEQRPHWRVWASAGRQGSSQDDAKPAQILCHRRRHPVCRADRAQRAAGTGRPGADAGQGRGAQAGDPSRSARLQGRAPARRRGRAKGCRHAPGARRRADPRNRHRLPPPVQPAEPAQTIAPVALTTSPDEGEAERAVRAAREKAKAGRRASSASRANAPGRARWRKPAPSRCRSIITAMRRARPTGRSDRAAAVGPALVDASPPARAQHTSTHDPVAPPPNWRNAIAPEIERGRSRTALRSLPLFTIHCEPARPVMMPT